MSFHTERQVKSGRAVYRCHWCPERILKGEPSVITAGVFEGDFFSGRYHPECAAAIKRYYTVNNCWGDEMPDGPMNRGGIEEVGEPERVLPAETIST